MNLSTFTNCYGEEWIAYSKGEELFIRGRDVDWSECPVDVATGVAKLPSGDGLVLDQAEQLWVAACAAVQRTINTMHAARAS